LVLGRAGERAFGDIAFTPIAEIAHVSVDRWSTEGIVGGYTHLKEACSEIGS
jgi:UDP-glucose 4-epimerase